jgi:hypothetical protein
VTVLDQAESRVLLVGPERMIPISRRKNNKISHGD